MGLFRSLSAWQSARREKYISTMQEQNKCPDCGGRGFIMPAAYEYAYPFDCSGCNGTGSFQEWQLNRQ